MLRFLFSLFSLTPFFIIFPIALIGISIGIAGFVFSILMVIDCYNREFKDRQMWLIILLLGLVMGYGFIASIIYYFVVKQELDKKS